MTKSSLLFVFVLALLVPFLAPAPATAQVNGYVWASDVFDWTTQQAILKTTTITLTPIRWTKSGEMQDAKPIAEIEACRPNQAMGWLVSGVNCIDPEQASYNITTGRDGLPIGDGEYVFRAFTGDRYARIDRLRVENGAAYTGFVEMWPMSAVKSSEPKMYWFYDSGGQLRLGVALPLTNGYNDWRPEIALRLRLRGPGYNAPDANQGEVPFNGKLPAGYSGAIYWSFPVSPYAGNIEAGGKFCLEAEAFYPPDPSFVYFRRNDCVPAQQIFWWSQPLTTR